MGAVQLLLDWNTPSLLFLALATMVLAYTVFSLLGFGSALLASAPLAAVMPVAQVIPLLAILDFVGATSRGLKACRSVDRKELGQLLPSMLVGQIAGVLVLACLPLKVMAALLGAFIVIQGLRGLRPQPAGSSQWVHRPYAVLGFGLFGGLLGGLFGSGGFVYASYLERRLTDREAFRATQAVLIALSTAWRVILCSLAGLVDPALLCTAILLSPAAYAGLWLGRHLDIRLSREQLFVLLNCLLVLSGGALMLRYLR